LKYSNQIKLFDNVRDSKCVAVFKISN
jgi:hypothetical protein